jgi:hypothetical protein
MLLWCEDNPSPTVQQWQDCWCPFFIKRGIYLSCSCLQSKCLVGEEKEENQKKIRWLDFCLDMILLVPYKTEWNQLQREERDLCWTPKRSLRFVFLPKGFPGNQITASKKIKTKRKRNKIRTNTLSFLVSYHYHHRGNRTITL